MIDNASLNNSILTRTLANFLQTYLSDLLELARYCSTTTPEEYMKVEPIVNEVEKSLHIWQKY